MTREYNEARRQQGFKSAEHLAAFFVVYDHARECPNCQGIDGGMEVDDGWQPAAKRCDEWKRLDREYCRMF